MAIEDAAPVPVERMAALSSIDPAGSEAAVCRQSEASIDCEETATGVYGETPVSTIAANATRSVAKYPAAVEALERSHWTEAKTASAPLPHKRGDLEIEPKVASPVNHSARR